MAGGTRSKTLKRTQTNQDEEERDKGPTVGGTISYRRVEGKSDGRIKRDLGGRELHMAGLYQRHVETQWGNKSPERMDTLIRGEELSIYLTYAM